MDPSTIKMVLTLTAFVTAAISGAVGMGGGVTLLAVMSMILPPQIVVPIHGVVQLSSNGTRLWAFRKNIRWEIVKYFVPMLVIGAGLARYLWDGEKLTWFKPVIGVFILLFLITKIFKPKLKDFRLGVFLPLGMVTGFLGIFVGATGPFIAPFFLREDMEKENVVATKAACQAFLHVLKIPVFLSLGFAYNQYFDLLLPLIIAVMIGTYVGKVVLSKLPQRAFLVLFQSVLFSIAVYLIIS